MKLIIPSSESGDHDVAQYTEQRLLWRSCQYYNIITIDPEETHSDVLQ